jgi:cytochrome P450
MFYDPDFMPFQPRRQAGWSASVNNYLENWPPEAYVEGFSTLPGFWPIIPKTIYLTDPELIEDVLITRAEFFTRDWVSSRAMSNALDPGGLFLAEGAGWRWQRRAVAPPFRHENLLALVPVFAQCASAQAQEWRHSNPAGAVDVAAAMSRTTFEVIERAVLGSDDAIDREKFLSALAAAFGGYSWRLMLAFLRAPQWTPHPGFFKVRAAIRHLHGETAKAIAARRAAGSSRRDILDLLLSARDPETGRVMNDAELTANLYTFIVAGHETAAVALGWSLWLLAKDQASQDRVRKEVAQVAGAGEIGPDTVEKLVFTRQAIQESMRLFPPAPGIGRQAREDTMIGSRAVSKQTPIFVATWSLHRNEKLWDEPNAFDPDRFAPERVKARHRCAFLPFGAGPRICIGINFAMLEIVTILATLMREFRFSPASGFKLELSTHVTLRAKGGLPLTIELV